MYKKGDQKMDELMFGEITKIEDPDKSIIKVKVKNHSIHYIAYPIDIGNKPIVGELVQLFLAKIPLGYSFMWGN